MIDAILFDINVQYLVAGFAGGVIHAFFVTRARPWDIIGYVVVGGLASNFSVGPLLVILPKVLPPILVPLPAGSDGLIGVIMGMAGFHILRRIDRFIETWNPFKES